MRAFAWVGCLGFAAAILFVGFPELDLRVAGLAFNGPKDFTWSTNALATLAHHSVRWWSGAFVLLSVVGALVGTLRQGRVLGLEARQWSFVLLVFALGPGLLVNAVFKETYGRARPAYVEPLGGDAPFVPALTRGQGCDSNCSFVSGDAAAGFATVALPLAFAQPHPLGIAAALLFGAALGAMRILQGAHFLSDVTFAGIFVLLVALALRPPLVFPGPRLQHFYATVGAILRRTAAAVKPGSSPPKA